MEQVYVIYFGNYSGTPYTQAILDHLRPAHMPKVQGIGANRQLPLSEDFIGGRVDIASYNALHSSVSSYFQIHGVNQLNASILADPLARTMKWVVDITQRSAMDLNIKFAASSVDSSKPGE